MIHFLQGKGAMRARREWKLAVLLPRLPVPLLGLAIAVSSVQASCTGGIDEWLRRTLGALFVLVYGFIVV